MLFRNRVTAPKQIMFGEGRQPSIFFLVDIEATNDYIQHKSRPGPRLNIRKDVFS